LCAYVCVCVCGWVGVNRERGRGSVFYAANRNAPLWWYKIWRSQISGRADEENRSKSESNKTWNATFSAQRSSTKAWTKTHCQAANKEANRKPCKCTKAKQECQTKGRESCARSLRIPHILALKDPPFEAEFCGTLRWSIPGSQPKPRQLLTNPDVLRRGTKHKLLARKRRIARGAFKIPLTKRLS